MRKEHNVSQPLSKRTWTNGSKHTAANEAYPKQWMTRWAHTKGECVYTWTNPQTLLSSAATVCADLPVSLTPNTVCPSRRWAARDLRRINSSARARAEAQPQPAEAAEEKREGGREGGNGGLERVGFGFRVCVGGRRADFLRRQGLSVLLRFLLLFFCFIWGFFVLGWGPGGGGVPWALWNFSSSSSLFREVMVWVWFLGRYKSLFLNAWFLEMRLLVSVFFLPW